MEYIRKTIGPLGKTSTYVVEDLGIKRADIIEVVTQDELMEIKDEACSLLKVGYWKLLAKLSMCCKCYRWINQ